MTINLQPLNAIPHPLINAVVEADDTYEQHDTAENVSRDDQPSQNDNSDFVSEEGVDAETKALLLRLKRVLWRRFRIDAEIEGLTSAQDGIRKIKQMNFRELFLMAKADKRIDRNEFKLARGLYVLHLHENAKLPAANISEAVDCCVATVKSIIKRADDYDIEGPLFHQCRERGSRTRYLEHMIKHEIKYQPKVSRSAAAIAEVVNQRARFPVTPQLVRRILKRKLNMRYRKVQPQQSYVNKRQNIESRHNFAVELLEDLEKGLSIINIDESSYNSRGKNRHQWTFADPYAQMHTAYDRFENITLVVAISQHGQSWYHFVQGSHDAIGFALFIERLVADLDVREPGWRSRYVILLDNSSVHQKALQMERVLRLSAPLKFTGKASFYCMPVENYFWLQK